MKYAAYILIICLVASPSIFAGQVTVAGAQQIEESYSFENDLEGWTVHATNVNAELPPPITPSQDRAKDGLTSLKFLVNRDDSFQQVWIEKVFDIAPNQVYDVDIDYALGTADCCSNPFSLLTGITKKTPAVLADFASVGQDYVDTGEKTIVGYKWVDKQYSFTTRSDDQGKFHVIIGFFGNFPVRRIEYVDRVHLKITKRAEPCEYFSFEQDMEGWLPQGIDARINDGQPASWFIAPSTLTARDGYYSLKFVTTNSSEQAKVFVIRPFAVERKKRYQVTVEYQVDNGSLAARDKLITGVFKTMPETEEDLIPFYQEEAKKFPEVQGWQHKQYEFTARSKKSDVLYVVIGILAKNNGHHLFAFDNVCVTIIEK
jgi:hypothetical protein